MNKSKSAAAPTLATVLLWMQGLYFLATGIWPLLSINSFQYVTGSKTDHLSTARGDHWLVFTVAVLVIAIAVPLLSAAWRRVLHVETNLLAVSSSVALVIIEVVFVSRAAIPPIYLADAGIEALLLAGWIGVLISNVVDQPYLADSRFARTPWYV